MTGDDQHRDALRSHLGGFWPDHTAARIVASTPVPRSVSLSPPARRGSDERRALPESEETSSLPKKVRVNVGDVFVVPIDSERFGLGQVVGKYLSEAYFFALFARAYAADAPPPDIEAAVREDEVVLLALSLDAKLAAGHWKVIGHVEVDPARLPLPAYKEGVLPTGTFDVVDYSGKLRRRATRDEAEALPLRKVVAPVRLEKALRAVHGVEPWVNAYEDLRVPPEIARSTFQFR